MNHSAVQELLSAYAIDALSPADKELVEDHLATGCESCLEVLSEFEALDGLMGLRADPVAPPPAVKQSIMAALEAEEKDVREHIVRNAWSAEGDWQTIFPGITMRQLTVHPQTGFTVALIRMAAGSVLPRHRHLGPEEVFVLEGQGSNGDRHFSAGDYTNAPTGSIHESTTTDSGCLMLAVLPEIEFL